MRDIAIQNAIAKTPGQSYVAGQMVIGVTPDHLAIAFNQTEGNQNMILALDLSDAKLLFALLLTVGRKEGWIQ